MSLVISLVTKNEEHRYLDACLSWICGLTDRIFIYDDQSTDDTVEIARSYGVKSEIRPDEVASFTQAEGTFREAAWECMLETMSIRRGDWVLSIDADEFPVGDVHAAIDELHRGGWNGANIKIREMWDYDPLLERIDGFWGSISGVRLCHMMDGNHSFRSQGMASGSVPAYAFKDFFKWELPLEILHCGYADPFDRLMKYEYYSNLNHNHNPTHIRSIISEPTLDPWVGETPIIWRGLVG